MTYQCPRCRRTSDIGYCCGVDLAAMREWRMTPERVRAVHVLARGCKGLDEEAYRLRLRAVGVESSKQLSRVQFRQLMNALQRLPDAPKYTARKRNAA
ncbi:MAG: hypothetical protein P4L92_22855 [Rudaea sp.]|nr:hypothetical protein [Rudaea sp.]